MKNLFVLFLLTLTFVVSIKSQTDRDKMVFAAFDQVGIGISDLNEDVKALGLSSSVIQSDIETSLKTAGFIVDANAPQALYLTVRTIRNDDGSIAYALILYLDQGVILQRNSNSRFFGTTWDISGVYSTDKANLVSDVREQVLSLVDQFLVKYRKVNKSSQAIVSPPPSDANVGFTATKIAAALPPQLVITNKTPLKVYITVNGRQYVALPKTTKTIVTTAGNVTYQARVAGYDAFGVRKLVLKQGEAYSLSYVRD